MFSHGQVHTNLPLPSSLPPPPHSSPPSCLPFSFLSPSLPPLFFPLLSFPQKHGQKPSLWRGGGNSTLRTMKTNLRMIWLANLVEFLQMSGNCFDSPPQIHRVLESAEMSFLLRDNGPGGQTGQKGTGMSTCFYRV